MIKINLDQVVTVAYSHKRDSDKIKVVQESKYFFNLLTRKKHIWVKSFTISTNFSDSILPFNKESIDKILNHKWVKALYDEQKELFMEKPCALVKLSSGDIKEYYFDLDSQLDNFIKQFDELRIVRI